MPTIFLNPDRLQSKITDLGEFAGECSTAKAILSRESEDLGDPYKDISDFDYAVDTAVNALGARIEELTTIKNRIVQLNEDGVAVRDPNTGVIHLRPRRRHRRYRPVQPVGPGGC